MFRPEKSGPRQKFIVTIHLQIFPSVQTSSGYAQKNVQLAHDTSACQNRAVPPTNNRFLTLADVADVLNVTVRQAYALVRNGDLRGIQIGGRGQWRIENTALEDYIAKQYARSDQTIADLSAADELSEGT